MTHYQEMVANALQFQFRRQRWRKQTAEAIAEATEELTDYYTGQIYYVRLFTGEKTSTPPAMVPSVPLRTLPEWTLQCRVTTGEWYYKHQLPPYEQTTEPPSRIMLCHICGSDFADRRCEGEECDGLASCYSCWDAQHPIGTEWRLHEFERIPVKKVRTV